MNSCKSINEVEPLAAYIFKEVCAKCKSVLNTKMQEAYLYGSYARGDYNKWSDIDILITVNSDYLEIEKYSDSIDDISSELSLKYNITLSVTMKPAKQFERFADVLPYYSNVIKEGIRYSAVC